MIAWNWQIPFFFLVWVFCSLHRELLHLLSKQRQSLSSLKPDTVLGMVFQVQQMKQEDLFLQQK